MTYKLRAALEPFAKIEPPERIADGAGYATPLLKAGDFRRARKVLAALSANAGAGGEIYSVEREVIENLRGDIAASRRVMASDAIVLLRVYDRLLASSPANTGQEDVFRAALQKIADLIDSEAGEPLDDAIAIANAALASSPVQERGDVAGMREALKTLIKYGEWQLEHGRSWHPTLESALSLARASLVAA